MFLRKYEPSDCRKITRLFYETVHAVNVGDYTQEQTDAWTSGAADLERWNQSLLEHLSLVAVEGEKIIGFGDMDHTGYLDRLYIHKDHQRQGIATAICDALETAVPAPRFTVHASITARPFFEQRGYRVVKEQQVERQGILLTNFVMEKKDLP